MVKALEKLVNITGDEKKGFDTQIRHLLNYVQKPVIRRLRVDHGKSIRFLNLDEIYYFNAGEKIVQVHTYDKSFIISKTLSQLETELPDGDFARIHKSTIINMSYINEIIRWFSGTFKVKMKDKTEHN